MFSFLSGFRKICFLSLKKFSSHWKTLPRFSKIQKLSQSPSVSLIAIHKSLFTVCLRLGGTVLKLVGTSLYGGHNLLSWLRVKVTFKRWLGRIPTVPLWTARPVSMYSTKSYIVDRQWGSRDTKNPLKDDY